MKTEYGIPVPRGVQKDWSIAKVDGVRAQAWLRDCNVPSDWGQPTLCITWRDRFYRRRLIVAHYPKGRSATVRIDANGNWKTTFGDVE